jgi:hypothetical protein
MEGNGCYKELKNSLCQTRVRVRASSCACLRSGQQQAADPGARRCPLRRVTKKEPAVPVRVQPRALRPARIRWDTPQTRAAHSTPNKTELPYLSRTTETEWLLPHNRHNGSQMSIDLQATAAAHGTEPPAPNGHGFWCTKRSVCHNTQHVSAVSDGITQAHKSVVQYL